jgi:hypothetical protein
VEAIEKDLLGDIPQITACESQHVIQTNSGGSDKDNTIWINTVEHKYLDSSGDKPWQKERPWANWGDENLERAYMMGVYANGYHFIIYDHHKNGLPTLITWDGMSHLTYVVGSVFNFITKELSYLGYQWERFMDDKPKSTFFIDAAIGVFIDLVETAVGVVYGVVGIVVETIFNPIDTLFNIPGGIALSLEAIVEGIANTGSDIISLFTLGYVQL